MVDQAHLAQLAETSARNAEEARKADEERRKAAVEEAKKGAEAARKASLETLQEQEAMLPVPSQEGCDAIKVGAHPDEQEEIEQPDGPAQRASEGRPDVLTREMERTGERTGTQRRTAEARPARASYETRTLRQPKPE